MKEKINIKRTIVLFLILIGCFVLFFFLWLLLGNAPLQKDIVWGVSFSQKQAQLLGLSWKETYLAILDDLKPETVRIVSYWDLIEPREGEYFFDDLDFQVREAQKRKIKTILVIGRKVPRWPECHIPEWAKGLPSQRQEKALLEFLKIVVLRYRNVETIKAWQIENEPFFRFGECPKITQEFLEKEIKIVKETDNWKRPVIITDSGSNRFWVKTARLGDIVGISLYRKAWFREFHSYITYPFPPVFYYKKAQIIKKFFGKEVICTELQAEPWGPVLLDKLPLNEQERTMNPEQMRENIEFARKTGLREFYLWGAEWWYWLKVKQNQPEIWQIAKKCFLK